MLLTIRKKSQGWIAWLIVIIITIPFALFGINSYFEGANQVTVAKVEGETINAQTLESAMEQRRRFFRAQLGDNFDPSMVDNPQFRTQVVEGLVRSRLLQSYAHSNGLRLSDQALRQDILNSPEFQVEGNFDQEAYRRSVSARGYSTESWEQQRRVNGGIEQLQDGLASSAVVDPGEVDRLLAFNLQSRDAEYTVIAASDAISSVEVSDEEKREEYDGHPENYQQADRIKLDYVSLTVDDLAAEIELDDEEISQAYEASKGHYLKPEARIASHILLSVPRSADEAKQQEVLKNAEDITARLNSGEDFVALAEEFSDDPGSKRKGGDLGLITRGQMVPEFEAAVFSMTEGEISEPVKTEFGYHIIKLTSLAEESQKPLDDVREDVIKAEKARLAQTQFSETAETFRTLVFEEPDNLEAAAQALGLEVQISDWVTRDSGSGSFSNPRVRSAAFESTVLDEDLNSEVIEVGDETLIAMHKNEFEAEHLKSYDEVSAQIETSLKARKASEIAQKNGETLIEGLKQDSGLESIEFDKLPELREEARGAVDRQIAEQVFKEKLNEGEVLIKGFSLNNGDYAVYRLKGITPGDPESATPEQREAISSQIESRDSNSAFALFSEALRSGSDVEIFSSTLQDDADNLAAQ